MPIALSALEVNSEAQECETRLQEFLETAEQRRPQLLRMARRMTSCNEDAEDILQEAFMKAFKALARFRGEAKMSSWLGAIVQNTAHEHLRNRRGRVFVSLEYMNREDNEIVEINLPDPGKNPEERCESREIEHILRDEVSRLSLVCRRAIEMCALDETPQLDVAKSLNLSVATMKSRVFRGKRILARSLARRLGPRYLDARRGAMAADHRMSCQI